MRTQRPLFYLFFILLPIWLTSCESSDSAKSEEVEVSETNSEDLAVFRAQLDLALGQKSAWQRHWSSKIGDFGASDFELVVTDSIEQMEMPEKNPILEGDPLQPYQISHPEGNGTMDIYSYKVEAHDGLDHPFLNPDSEVIWYRGDGMKQRLLFMGPSGLFEEGLWLNASQFMVLGYFQEEDGYRPMAWIIDVSGHRFSQFRLNRVVQDYPQESYLDLKLKSVDLTTNDL